MIVNPRRDLRISHALTNPLCRRESPRGVLV